MNRVELMSRMGAWEVGRVKKKEHSFWANLQPCGSREVNYIWACFFHLGDQECRHLPTLLAGAVQCLHLRSAKGMRLECYAVPIWSDVAQYESQGSWGMRKPTTAQKIRTPPTSIP